MIGMQTFIRRKTFLTLSAFIFVGVAAPHALAGFEWIPQKKTPEAAPAMSEPEAVTPVPMDDVVLPLPSDSELEDPVAAAPALVEPEPMPAEPDVIIAEPEPMMPSPESPAVPTRISVMPKEEPNSGVMEMSSTPDTLPTISSEAEAKRVIPSDDPEVLKKPPFEMTKTKIIVPDDAPDNVVEQVEKKNSMIAPFPSQESLEATQEPPIKFTSDQPATLAVAPLENAVGFAEDVPLALALRQVVPADFAYSFGRNVNPGLRVSWNGGRPWNEVVADMVTSLGYAVVITQKTVLIVDEKSLMAPVPESDLSLMSLEPAAGDEESSDERERNIKRTNIVDPGSANKEVGLVEKVTRIFEPQETSDPAQAAAEPVQIALADVDADQSQIVVVRDKPSKISFWTAEEGASLKETLSQWSQSAGKELVWDATHDFQLSSDFEVRGDFEKAVDLLLKHGIEQDSAALEHSYVTTSGDNTMKIVIADKV